MRKYLYLIWISFQQLFEYRMNLVWRLAGTAIWTPVLYFFWLTIVNAGFGSGQYNAYSLGLYYIAISFIDFFIGFDVNQIAYEIREGYIAADLLKPYSYFAKLFLTTTADKVVHLLIFSIIYLILIITGMKAGVSFSGLLIALGFLFSATLMNFFITSTIGILGFWFKYVNGFNSLFHSAGGLFSGYLIPISLLPPLMASISEYLPYKYMFSVPASLFIKTPETSELIRLALVQFFWIVCSFLLLKFVWQKGIKKFEATGK